MIALLLESILFILPTYIANGFASLSAVMPILKNFKFPVDFGVEWDGKRILGKGKTFRGLIVGTTFGIGAGLIQYLISKNLDFQFLNYFENKELSFFIIYSFLLGFGGLFGDMVKSFAKRRIGIESGKSWPIFDQLDFIFGALLFCLIIQFPGWKIAITLIIITPLLHLLSNVIAYKLKLKSVWW